MKTRVYPATSGIGTTTDTWVQAAVGKVIKDRRCAVCHYETTSDTELGVHYVYETSGGYARRQEVVETLWGESPTTN